MSAIIYEVKDRIAKIVLNRPEARNALNKDMVKLLGEALDNAANDENVHVVVISAAGDKAFSAGFDLKESISAPILGIENRRENTRWELDTWLKIWDMKKPVIAAVRGFCIGGGNHLALMCDMIIAAEDAQFGEPEIEFSYIPDILIQPFKMPPNKVRELMMLGEMMSASEMYRVGTVNKLVPAEKLDEEAMKLAAKIAAMPKAAIAMLKTQINKAYEFMGFKHSADFAAELFNLCRLNQMDTDTEFNNIVKKDSLKAAMDWKKKQKAK
ncbi:MAG: enoyl-CoA hydratase/isomerase family protein [Synergistaceae bacterium]|jgi:enoyl-CoA hydratase|nr:enoyl-CoA hydratase/isomerase family protein [Synergistaceae bacterium]